MVADIPVVVALRTISALTVDADPTIARALLRAIVCQLTVLHSPEDVRIAAVVGSALVSRIADRAAAGNGVAEEVLGFVRQLAAGVRGARRG